MINHFDMAREMARLVDADKSADEIVDTMLGKFATATADDWARAARIGLERVELLEEEACAAALRIGDLLFNDAPDLLIDAAIGELEKLQPSAVTLFPQPDKSRG